MSRTKKPPVPAGKKHRQSRLHHHGETPGPVTKRKERRALVYEHIGVTRETFAPLHDGRPMYRIYSRKLDASIGVIVWTSEWQEWVAAFCEHQPISAGCLSDIQKAIRALTEQQPPDAKNGGEA